MSAEAIGIYRCTECGHYEGDLLRAGCCSNCGCSAMPDEIKMVPEARLEKAEKALWEISIDGSHNFEPGELCAKCIAVDYFAELEEGEKDGRAK